MYSIKEVMKGLGIRNLSFDGWSVSEKIAREIFSRGIYGGVRDRHEVVLAVPLDTDNIMYVCSRRSPVDSFAMGYPVNSPGFIRVMYNEGAQKFVHEDYEKQLKKNAECKDMVLFQSRDPEDNKNPEVVVYGVHVGEEGFTVRKSEDFPSKIVTGNHNQINIIKEFCVEKDNFPVSRGNKEELLRQLKGLVVRRKQYLWGHTDLRRCRVFMYDKKAYIVTKKRGEQVYNIYALVQNSDNQMDLIKVDHYKIDELEEAAKKEFKPKC